MSVAGTVYLIDNKNETGNKERKCYDELGCVEITPVWYDVRYRPVNMMPADRHAVNTIFIRWKNDQNLTSEVIGNSDINPLSNDQPMKIMIHDFTSNGYAGWIEHLARAFLLSPATRACHVLSVNWASGAEPPYAQAVANARLVALEIISFLRKCKPNELQGPSNIHAIGHGLGAHIAGYVGKTVHLQRITALDPSKLYFEGMPPLVRLHKLDATYVEVVHTHTDGHGYEGLLGHVDFYPNGGKKQPGCADTRIRLIDVKRDDLHIGQILPACSHKRAAKYYIEAITNPMCPFVGMACESYKSFMKGKCPTCERNNSCAHMNPSGFPKQITDHGGPYYFVTSNARPFCCEMLKILLVLKSKFFDDNAYVKGYFLVTIPQHNGNITFPFNENRVLSALRVNEHHSFLVFRTTPPALEMPVNVVYLKWFHGRFPCSWFSPPHIQCLLISKLTNDRGDVAQWFCPLSGYADHDTGLSLVPCHKNIDKLDAIPYTN